MTSKAPPKAAPARLGRGKTSGVWQAIRADFAGFERRRIVARSDWAALAAQLAAEGVEDGNGRPPSAAVVKRVFYRVRLAVREDRAALVALDVAAAEAAAADARRVAEARAPITAGDVRDGVARLLAQACEGGEAERLAVLAALPYFLPVLGMSAPAATPAATLKVPLPTPEAAPKVVPKVTLAAPAPAAQPAPVPAGASFSAEIRAAAQAEDDAEYARVLRGFEEAKARKASKAPAPMDDRSPEARTRRRVELGEAREEARRFEIIAVPLDENGRKTLAVMRERVAELQSQVEGDSAWEAAQKAAPVPAPAGAARQGKRVVDMTPEETEAAVKADADAEYDRITRILTGGAPDPAPAPPRQKTSADYMAEAQAEADAEFDRLVAIARGPKGGGA